MGGRTLGDDSLRDRLVPLVARLRRIHICPRRDGNSGRNRHWPGGLCDVGRGAIRDVPRPSLQKEETGVNHGNNIGIR